jgi:hypothetical protein
MMNNWVRTSLILLLFSHGVMGQSLADGIYMPKNTVCAGGVYMHDAWDEYWEGTLQRTNGNIGTVTTQMAGIMANYGITDRINLIAYAPWVKTQASAGSLAGQRGIQDLTLGFKWKPFEKQIMGGSFSAQAIGIGSIPLTNYVADHLPLAIGMQSKTATGRLLFHFLGQKGLTFTAFGGYTARSKVQIDRNSFYTTHLIEGTEVVMPDMAHFGARAGYYTYRVQAEVLYDYNGCTSGNDIRRQDMPFLTNKMQAGRLGIYLSYRVKPLKDIQITATAQQVLTGRNVGKSQSLSFGIFKAFGLKSST